MSNSYIPPSQQWNPNSFNFRHLQLEHDLDYNNLSVLGQQQQLHPQQQQQLDFSAHRYPQPQIPSSPHSSSSLHGAFIMPTNQQSRQDSPPLQGNNQHDFLPNSYANHQQQPATQLTASTSYHPTPFNFSSSSRAASSAINLDPGQTSNVSSTFLKPHGAEAQQRSSHYPPPSTTKESIPQKRARTFNYELNPEDADLDSEPTDQKEGPNKSKL